MATRRRKEAATAYLASLSEITACYAENISFVQRSSPDVVDAIVVSPAREDPIPLRDGYGAVRLALAVTLHYVVEEALKVPTVRTVAYQYVFETLLNHRGKSCGMTGIHMSRESLFLTFMC